MRSTTTSTSKIGTVVDTRRVLSGTIVGGTRASIHPALVLSLESADAFPYRILAVLPPDRGVRHEVDLVPGSNIVLHSNGRIHGINLQQLTHSLSGAS